MVTSISNNNSISDQISGIIDELEEDLGVLKKQDAKETGHKLLSLLIEYILAQMTDDTEKEKEINDQIVSLIQTYSNDIQKADHLKSQLKTIENDPNDQTVNELNLLKNLLALVTKNLQTGDMSNLPANV